MDVPEVSCDEAASMHDAGATWIDVREPDEWREAHIEGTEHVPLAAAVDEVPRILPDRASTIVVSCLSGGRSGHLVAHLRAQGYLDVHNLRGGILAWMREDRPVVVGS